MRSRSLWQVLTAMILLASAGCNTQFSSEWTRQEIVRQMGAQPGNAFEFTLEETTMKLAQAAASTTAGKPASFGGLARIDLANNALPLYFSRPLTRWDYMLSRLMVLLGILSLVIVYPWKKGLFEWKRKANAANAK